MSDHADTAKLKRVLSLWNLIIIGIVFIQPIAPCGIYGVVNNTAKGHVVTTILIAMFAMLFTAISYGRMSVIYPSAGSAYTYVGKELHPSLGYITGWSMLMDYILNPLICVALSGKLILNVVPPIPLIPPDYQFYFWIIVFSALFTFLNLRGIQTSARINEWACAIMMIVVLIFFAYVLHFLFGLKEFGKNFFIQPFYNPQTFSVSSVFAGTSVAVLTYIGFDGISTLSEEAKNPRRDILWATVLVCIIIGLLSALEVYGAQLVWGAGQFPESQVESAFPLVARKAGGAFLFYLINITILVATMGSGMGAQIAAGRLLYGMGRSNALPKKFFAIIDPVSRIPMNNIILVGLLALLGAGSLELMSSVFHAGAYEVGAQALNFGALIGFMGVNASSISYFWVKADKRKLKNLVPPLLGFIVCLFLWLQLATPAKILGGTWLIIGIIYGVIRTRGFRSELVNFNIPTE